MQEMCVFTVAKPTTNSPAISVLDSPRPTKISISRSRDIEFADPLGDSRIYAETALLRLAISRLVIDGASNASPLATTLIPATSSSGGRRL